MPLETSIVATVDSNISANINTDASAVNVELTTSVSSGTGGPYVPFRVKQSTDITDVQDAQVTKGFRQTAAMYVDGNGTNYRMSLEQVKNLSTKILNVDSLSEDISNLSANDYIYLNQN